MLEFIAEYSQVINIALFGTIVGWLFKLQSLTKSSLNEQFAAKLAVKDKDISELNIQIGSLKTQLRLNETAHQKQLEVVNHSREFFERLASMKGDDRVEALKLEYNMRLEKLKKREKELSDKLKSKSSRTRKGVGTKFRKQSASKFGNDSLSNSARKKDYEMKLKIIQSEINRIETEKEQVLSLDSKTFSLIADVASNAARVTGLI